MVERDNQFIPIAEPSAYERQIYASIVAVRDMAKKHLIDEGQADRKVDELLDDLSVYHRLGRQAVQVYDQEVEE